MLLTKIIPLEPFAAGLRAALPPKGGQIAALGSISSVFGPNPHLSYWNGFGFATNRPGRRQEQGPQSTGGQDPRPVGPGQGGRPERPVEGRPVDHQGQEHHGGGRSTLQGGVAAAGASGFVPAPEAVGFGPGAAVQ